MAKKAILWILTILCMATIFFFSSQTAPQSKKSSSGFIETVIKIIDFNNSLDDKEIGQITESMTFLVRKGAHFSIYALLGALILLLVYEYKVDGWLAVLTAVLLSTLYACSDEFHQTFVSGRSGELRDVIIDAVGALVGCVIVILISKIILIRRNRNGLQKNL